MQTTRLLFSPDVACKSFQKVLLASEREIKHNPRTHTQIVESKTERCPVRKRRKWKLNEDLLALICCYKSFHSSGKNFHMFWNLAAETCSHSATRALVRSTSDGGWCVLAAFQFFLKVFKLKVEASLFFVEENTFYWTLLSAREQWHAGTRNVLPWTCNHVIGYFTISLRATTLRGQSCTV